MTRLLKIIWGDIKKHRLLSKLKKWFLYVLALEIFGAIVYYILFLLGFTIPLSQINLLEALFPFLFFGAATLASIIVAFAIFYFIIFLCVALVKFFIDTPRKIKDYIDSVKYRVHNSK